MFYGNCAIRLMCCVSFDLIKTPSCKLDLLRPFSQTSSSYHSLKKARFVECTSNNCAVETCFFTWAVSYSSSSRVTMELLALSLMLCVPSLSVYVNHALVGLLLPQSFNVQLTDWSELCEIFKASSITLSLNKSLDRWKGIFKKKYKWCYKIQLYSSLIIHCDSRSMFFLFSRGQTCFCEILSLILNLQCDD